MRIVRQAAVTGSPSSSAPYTRVDTGSRRSSGNNRRTAAAYSALLYHGATDDCQAELERYYRGGAGGMAGVSWTITVVSPGRM